MEELGFGLKLGLVKVEVRISIAKSLGWGELGSELGLGLDFKLRRVGVWYYREEEFILGLD